MKKPEPTPRGTSCSGKFGSGRWRSRPGGKKSGPKNQRKSSAGSWPDGTRWLDILAVVRMFTTDTSACSTISVKSGKRAGADTAGSVKAARLAAMQTASRVFRKGKLDRTGIGD